MALDSLESKYFRALVGYAQPADFAEKDYWFEQIVALNNTPKRSIGSETLQYFSEWHHAGVRAVLDTCDCADDGETLARKLFNRITPSQALESIRLLENLHLIAKDNHGFWKPTEKVVSTGDQFKAQCIQRFHLSNQEVLQQILEEDKPGTHDSSQLTVSVSPKGLERIVNRIRQLRSEIMAITHKDDEKSDRVYQIAIHAYPLSRKD